MQLYTLLNDQLARGAKTVAPVQIELIGKICSWGNRCYCDQKQNWAHKREMDWFLYKRLIFVFVLFAKSVKALMQKEKERFTRMLLLVYCSLLSIHQFILS